MAIVVAGRRINTEPLGFPSLSFAFDKAIPQMTWSSPRDPAKLRGGMFHTTQGQPVVVEIGGRTHEGDVNQAKRQGRPLSRDANGKVTGTAGYDFVIGASGRVVQTNDPAKRATVHGHTGNGRFIGIGMVQLSGGVVTTASLSAAAALYDALSFCLVLPRQHYWVPGAPAPYSGRLAQIEQDSGTELAGCIGHRNAWIRNSKGVLTSAKGKGDPGDPIFVALPSAYDRFDPREDASGEDEGRRRWRERQIMLGFPPAQCDGIVGAATRKAIRDKGFPNGVWVERPMDDLLRTQGW